MAPEDDFTPDGLTTQGIPTTRRGLDRKVVERLMEQARAAWSDLASSHAELLERVDEAGGIEYLSLDIGALAAEIRSMLGAAEEAADGMRERARVESERKLAEASQQADVTKAESARLAGIMRSDAESDAFAMRKDAWDESLAMLEQVAATVEAMISEADADVLIIRADAEQEALRKVAQARREGDDIVRNARFEAERTVSEAKALASELLEEANRDASAAQERTRALEDRRRALLTELQSNRETSDETGVRVVDQPEQRRPRRSDTFPDVRPRRSIDHLAYADELAAEVEALGTSAEESDPVEPPLVVPEPDPEPPAPRASEPEPEPEPEPEAVSKPEAHSDPDPEPAPEAVLEPALVPEPESAAEAVVEDVVDEEPSVVDEPADDASDEGDDASAPESPGLVDDLFARLRAGGSAGPGPTTPAPVADEPVGDAPDHAKPEEAPRRAVMTLDVDDPLAVRDGLLLPITNAALREVKQAIMELQNLALDSLRTDDEWKPDVATTHRVLSSAIDGLGEAAAEAGAEAATALGGATDPAPLLDTRSGGLVRLMTDDLNGQVLTALDRSRDAGPRERSTELSRVYRAWRVDEAERWVRTIAGAAYHDSLVAGLAGAGVERVASVPHGTLCAECPAQLGESWDPSGEPPGASSMPPAHLDCSCTVAPTG